MHEIREADPSFFEEPRPQAVFVNPNACAPPNQHGSPSKGPENVCLGCC